MDTLNLSDLLKPRRKLAPKTPTVPVPVVQTTVDESDNTSKHSLLDAMRDRGVVLRFVATEDETGGSTSQYIQAGSYRCNVRYAGNPDEAGNGIQVTSDAPYIIEFPIEADVQPSDKFGVPGWFNTWQPNIAVSSGQKMIPTRKGGNGYLYEVIQDGVTGNVEPDISVGDWPTAIGAVIENGTTKLKNVGKVDFYEIVGNNEGLTNQDILVVNAKKVDYQ